jgi:type VI protein secretion system component Hcp
MSSIKEYMHIYMKFLEHISIVYEHIEMEHNDFQMVHEYIYILNILEL